MLIETFKLEVGWVVRSVHFRSGNSQSDENGRPIIMIDTNPRPSAAHDPSRDQALFVIEDTKGEGCDHTYGCCYWVTVTARRLKDDGSDDPAGERIRFNVMFGRTDPLERVEVVGQMAHDGSGVTYTLPKISP